MRAAGSTVGAIQLTDHLDFTAFTSNNKPHLCVVLHAPQHRAHVVGQLDVQRVLPPLLGSLQEGCI